MDSNGPLIQNKIGHKAAEVQPQTHNQLVRGHFEVTRSFNAINTDSLKFTLLPV